MMADEALTPADKEFALNEVSKIIQIPVNDFITNYAKFNSKV